MSAPKIHSITGPSVSPHLTIKFITNFYIFLIITKYMKSSMVLDSKWKGNKFSKKLQIKMAKESLVIWTPQPSTEWEWRWVEDNGDQYQKLKHKKFPGLYLKTQQLNMSVSTHCINICWNLELCMLRIRLSSESIHGRLKSSRWSILKRRQHA